MELVYIINNKRDFDKFVSIYPNAKWQGSSPFVFDTLTHFMGHSLTNFPIALYYRPNSKVEWSRYDTALDLTTQSPFEYQWAELWPKLSTIDIFRKFLQHHEAYDAFEANRTAAPSTFVNIYTRHAVSNAFKWGFTNQGIRYWSDIGLKWRKLMKDLQIPDECIDNFYTQLFIIDGETNDNT